jgi:hypothetical protein
MQTYTQNEINDLASSALDVACAFIQEQMNIPSGDLAGIFFTGRPQELIETLFKSYIRAEINCKNSD